MTPSPFVVAGVSPWDDVPYDEQLLRRHALVVSAFQHGRIDVAVDPVVPSPRTWGYRARVRLRGDGQRVGFHREGTHTLVEGPIERIARPEIVEVLPRIRKLNGEIELRSDGETVRADTTYGGFGAGPLVIDGLRVSSRSFFQVNLEVNRLIVDAVDAELQRAEPKALLDLFGGVGNLSVRAARRGVPVVLVEREGAAADDARHNLKGTPAKVIASDARSLRAGDHFADVVLLDPPRAGAPGLLATLAVTRPRVIVYLACGPATLARDVATMLPLGYRITRLTPFDMFPGTEHIETLCVLSR